ncbi:nicotinamide riboside transporter PnuC [Acinetobacter larvae]|uniref:Nicotinamide riboside transporter PnuC n=1 Tax=Acinetobacter larvae TaxID=1789224 RepID=A0A1B2LX69_9GAMM|nr:nicotinamide riboside transporter PnuC [Acinetobacter larvae]AOA57525.1 nucleoside transporter [Acinetobacter larvae]
MTSLEIIAVPIAIFGVILTIKRRMACWLINMIACLLYSYIFYQSRLFAETILQFFFIAMNIYGFYHWRRGQQLDHEIRIEAAGILKMLGQLCCAISLGLLFGWSLHYFSHAALPYLDAMLAALSLLATYWSSRKYIATWYMWIILNTCYVGMFIFSGLWLTAMLYAIFIGLAFVGWQQWHEAWRKQCY